MTLDIYPNDNRNRPHTKVIVDSTAIGANSSESQKAVVVYGSALGGQPNEFYKLTSFAQAKAIFKGGELLDFIEVAWRPSSTLQGAGVIYAMRVDTATQSVITKGDLTFSSYQYGAGGNNVSISLEDGTLPGSHKFTAYDSATQATEVYDNVGRIIDIQQSPASTKTYTSVTVADSVLTLKSGNDQPTAVPVATFALNDSLSVPALVSQISRLADFQALVLPYGDKNIDLSKLEPLTETVVTKDKAANLTALSADLVNQLQYSGLVTAKFTA